MCVADVQKLLLVGGPHPGNHRRRGLDGGASSLAQSHPATYRLGGFLVSQCPYAHRVGFVLALGISEYDTQSLEAGQHM